MQRPPLPPPPHAGGCLCGAVRYCIAARPLAVNACHCTDCKRLSGGAAGIFVHATRETLIVESGALAHYRKTADSGRQVDVARCAVCGSRMWHAPAAGGEVAFVTVGSLDDPSWAIPTSHIWTSRAAPDAAYADDALMFEGPPPDRQLLWDRFAEIYPA